MLFSYILGCSCSTTTVTSHRASAKGIHHTKGLCIVVELRNTGVIASTFSLPLAAEKNFQWVLANVHTEKS